MNLSLEWQVSVSCRQLARLDKHLLSQHFPEHLQAAHPQARLLELLQNVDSCLLLTKLFQSRLQFLIYCPYQCSLDAALQHLDACRQTSAVTNLQSGAQ